MSTEWSPNPDFSRYSFSSLSKKIRAAQDTITKRYKKLVENNVIKSVIQINPKIIGYKAFPSFSLAFSSKVKMDYVIDYLMNIPDVIHIIMTSGEFELIVYAFVRSIEQFLEVKEKILQIKELTSMECLGILNRFDSSLAELLNDEENYKDVKGVSIALNTSEDVVTRIYYCSFRTRDNM